MPVELSQFFASANKLADNQALFVKNGNLPDGEALQSKSTLTGLSKLSSSKQSTERNNSIDSFIHSIKASKYQASFANVEAIINQAKADGKGLTKELVEKVKVMFELEGATSKAEVLSQQAKIPVGHKTSFAQFAVAYNHPLGTDAEIQQTLTDYLKSQVFKPVESLAMQKLYNLDGNNANELATKTEANALLRSFYHKQGMSDISKSPEGAAIIAEGVQNNLPFTQIEANLKAYFEQTFDQLANFDNAALSMVSNLSNPREIIAFVNNQIANGILTCQDVSGFLQDTYFSLEGNLNQTVNQFQVKNVPIEDASAKLVGIGISKEQADVLAITLKHYPTVESKALETLKADGHIPATKAQATAAYDKALTEFLAVDGDKIKELLSFINSPEFEGTKLLKPLTDERLSQLVNAYLGLAPVTTMLLDLNPNSVTEIMDAALLANKSLESCTYAFGIYFGPQDVQDISIDCISIQLAMAGLKQTDLPATLQKTVEKFGALTSDVNVLTAEVMNQNLPDTIGNFGSNAKAISNLLEAFSGTIISKMSDTQLQSFGLNTKEKINSFKEDNFQADKELTQLSPELIQFARERGVVIPDTIRFEAPVPTTAHDQRQIRLENINNAAIKSLHAKLYTDGTATTFLTDIVAQYVAENPVLAGLKINVDVGSDFTKAVRIAINNELDLANAEGREVNINALNDFVQVELTSYLDNCAIMARNIHQFAVDSGIAQDAAVKLANQSSDLFYYSVNDLALLEGGETTISLALPRLLENINHIIKGIDLSHTEDAGISLALNMMNVISPLSDKQMQNLYNNITSPAAKDFADSVKLMYSNEMLQTSPPKVKENSIKVRSQIPLIMEGLRQMSGQALGKDAELRTNKNLYTSGDLTHVTQIKDTIINELSSVTGVYHGPARAKELIANGISNKVDFDFMNKLLDSYSSADRHFASLGESFIVSMSQHFTDANNASIIVDKAFIYNQLFHEPLPSSVSDRNFFQLIENKAVDVAYNLVKASKPDVTKEMIQQSFLAFSISTLSFDKLLSLFRPDAKLELADFRKLELSTIRGYNEDSAFGLVIDFRRMEKKSVLEFNGLTASHTVSPFDIPDEENNPNNPEFKHIIEVVDKMCQSELQKIRVLQAFSQASVVEARMKSLLFVGELLDEHGGYNISAQEQQDGSVVINIKLIDESALDYSEQIVVQPDGSAAITQFNMSKNIVIQ